MTCWLLSKDIFFFNNTRSNCLGSQILPDERFRSIGLTDNGPMTRKYVYNDTYNTWIRYSWQLKQVVLLELVYTRKLVTMTSSQSMLCDQTITKRSKYSLFKWGKYFTMWSCTVFSCDFFLGQSSTLACYNSLYYGQEEWNHNWKQCRIT
jgi:hypothetical protein